LGRALSDGLRRLSASGVVRLVEGPGRLAVMLGVQLARLITVVLGVEVVGMRDMGMVRRLLMVAGVVGLRGLAVVPRGMVVVLCRLVMVLQLFFV
jgi:hypothetical protein